MKRKGAFDVGTNLFIILVLGIFLFLLAYSLLFTDLGPRALNFANYYAFSKAGVTVSPEEFAKITPQGILYAKITAEPSSPVCNYERIYFSAYNTQLPKDVEFEDISCLWDFDLSTEPKTGPYGSATNDSNTENDYEANTCNASESRAWPFGEIVPGENEKQGVKLLIVDPTGRQDDATVLIKSILYCACTAGPGICPGGIMQIDAKPQIPSEFLDGQALNISIKSSWNLENIHLIAEPTGNVSNFIVVIGESRTGSYTLRGEIKGQFVIYGQNLLNGIETARGRCAAHNIEPCEVPFTFYFNGGGSIKIKEIWMPLSAF